MNPVNYLETDVLHCGDNLKLLPQFPAECIDMIYLDPPFFTNRSYEVIWEDDAEIRSFEDRWEGGIQVYLDWMETRVRHLHRILKATGALYLAISTDRCTTLTFLILSPSPSAVERRP